MSFVSQLPIVRVVPESPGSEIGVVRALRRRPIGRIAPPLRSARIPRRLPATPPPITLTLTLALFPRAHGIVETVHEPTVRAEAAFDSALDSASRRVDARVEGVFVLVPRASSGLVAVPELSSRLFPPLVERRGARGGWRERCGSGSSRVARASAASASASSSSASSSTASARVASRGVSSVALRLFHARLAVEYLLAESYGLGRERYGCRGGEELAEEHERVESPSLEDEYASREESDAAEEDVLVAAHLGAAGAHLVEADGGEHDARAEDGGGAEVDVDEGADAHGTRAGGDARAAAGVLAEEGERAAASPGRATAATRVPGAAARTWRWVKPRAATLEEGHAARAATRVRIRARGRRGPRGAERGRGRGRGAERARGARARQRRRGRRGRRMHRGQTRSRRAGGRCASGNAAPDEDRPEEDRLERFPGSDVLLERRGTDDEYFIARSSMTMV